jgi:hypothetical protein
MKRIVCLFLILTIALLMTHMVYAHTNPIEHEVTYGECTGWIVFTDPSFDGLIGHMSATSNPRRVTFDLVIGSESFQENIEGTTRTYEDAIREAVRRWNATGTTSINVRWDIPGMLLTYGTIEDKHFFVPGGNLYGRFGPDRTAINPFDRATGHYNNGWSFFISTVAINDDLHDRLINRRSFTPEQFYERVVGIIAHELGHGFGLAHVSLTRDNNDKLMYDSMWGSPAGWANSPTAADIAGMRVITGIETAHTFAYTPANTLFTQRHLAECTQCRGHRHEPHNYNIPRRDNNHHWSECTCGQQETKIAHNLFDQRNDIYHWNGCFCGHETPRIPHVYNIPQSNDTQHWNNCACGQQGPRTNHTVTSWRTVSAAGCTTNGTHENSRDTPINPSAHTGGTATCTARATCSRCNVLYGSVNSNNHSWSGWSTTAATCMAHGNRRRTCTRNCGVPAQSETIPIDPNAHLLSTTAWGWNTAHHWRECTVTGCSAVSSRAFHAAAPTRPGSCSTCGRAGNFFSPTSAPVTVSAFVLPAIYQRIRRRRIL